MGLDEILAWVPRGSDDEALVRRLDFERLPSHIAIIMDGNGRWAARRHLPRVEGHRAGIDAVRDTVEASARLGIRVLTLYAFSVENWKRPRTEVQRPDDAPQALPGAGARARSAGTTSASGCAGGARASRPTWRSSWIVP